MSIEPCTAHPEHRAIAETLAVTARGFTQRGWMLGTSGSVSARIAHDPLAIAITVSGKDKGDLDASDLLLVTDDGHTFATLGDPEASSTAFYKGQPRPSGETLVHEAIYRKFSSAGAVYHVHTVDNTLCSQLTRPGQSMVFHDLEMLKGLGHWEEHHDVLVPVVPNHRDIPTLAQAVADAAVEDVPGVLVQDHGIYVWGPDMARTKRHIEIFEFLFSWEIKRRLLGL